jgi:hypothetical protein
MLRLALGFFSAAILFGQGPVNLDFEDHDIEGNLKAWISSPGASFVVARLEDCGVPGAEDARCAMVRHDRDSRERYWVTQTFDAKALRGKRIRYRAAVRLKALGQAQIFVRVDCVAGVGMLQYSGRGGNPSRDWTVREVAGTVDDDAEKITIGLTFEGLGTAYFAQPEFEVVDARN